MIASLLPSRMGAGRALAEDGTVGIGCAAEDLDVMLGAAGAAALFAGIHPWWHAPASSAPGVGITAGGGAAGCATVC